MFEKFYQYLNAKKQFQFLINQQHEQDFAAFILKASNSSEFLTQFLQYEKTAMSEKQNQNLPLRRLLLDDLAFYPDDKFPKWLNFDSYLHTIKQIINLLPKELLDLEITLYHIPFLGKFTVLSLSMDYLLNLYKKNRESHFENHRIYQEMQLCWKNEIIDPLLSKGCDPYKGTCTKHSILVACMYEYLPPDIDQCISVLSESFIEQSKDINNPNNRGKSPLAIAVLRDFPEEMIIKLVKKGADVNICCAESTLVSKTEQPLLCHLVKNKMYAKLELLLHLGANPNQIPKYDGYIFQTQKREETWLSAYQLAVALNDDQAIAIIQKVSLKNKIELIPDLNAIELERNEFFSQNKKLYYQGNKLYLQCKSRLFKTQDHALTEIHKKYGIKCYVNKHDDRQNMSDAISWLMEKASDSCAARFWKLAYKYLMHEFSKNSNFSILTSCAPSTVTKNKACAGLLDEGIHIECGLPVELIIDTLAHEIGHLVDKKTFCMGSLIGLVSKEVQLFEEAFVKDLSKIDLSNISETFALNNSDFWLKVRLKDFMTLYNSKKSIHEYFTYILFELPINYARCNPHSTEKDMLNMMHNYFPNALAWYFSHEEKLVDYLNMQDEKNSVDRLTF